jgi:hypothetical protein
MAAKKRTSQILARARRLTRQTAEAKADELVERFFATAKQELSFHAQVLQELKLIRAELVGRLIPMSKGSKTRRRRSTF